MLMVYGKGLWAWLSTDFLVVVTSLLRVPVLILLYGLTLWVIVEIGMTSFEWLVRTGRLMKKEQGLRDLEDGLREMKAMINNDNDNDGDNDNATGEDGDDADASNGNGNRNMMEAIGVLKSCTTHRFVLQFLNRLVTLDNDDGQFHIRVLKLIQSIEEEISKRVERTRAMVRMGPILGLMGTLIPMGPALLALTRGDVNTLAISLIYAFGTTVLGLLVGGVAYVITAIRQHWYDRDMNDIRYICEMLFGGE